ncbi:MAG TPA: MerR family transcriptional regulator [Candidatus Deferrimicrobium sp.]|nr:MerR family transcriptional regulator [Candidatus Deferrimicrobium sp.]
MYSIKQTSIRSGVSVPLIRAWERRYGVISPKRTPSGYRLYDDEAIATLVRVRELTENGWSASEASRAILAGEVGVLPIVQAVPAPLNSRSARTRQADLTGRFLAAATEMDIAATGAVLDEIFAQGSFESIVDELLMPALASLGWAWTEGQLDIAAEHAASAAIHRRLSALYEAAAVIGDTSVVVGLPPEGRHELGALAFAVALRRLGVGVLYLGADVPVASWVHVIRQQRARVVVLAVVQDSEQLRALEVAEALRAAGHSPVFAVGGRSANWDGAREAGIVVLPDRINEAASVAARLAAGTVAAR